MSEYVHLHGILKQLSHINAHTCTHTHTERKRERDVCFYITLSCVFNACAATCCCAEPVPMRMRALPQSMWQEPNIPHNVSPATVYPVLPPLVTREGDDITGA